jgi:RNA polymerase sigma-70 factor (ECF subfamily)
MSKTQDAPADAQRRFEALVEPHLGRLLRFARSRTPALSDAEDAVQEACLRAWRAFPQLREDTKILPWLYRILRAVLSDVASRNHRRRRLAEMTSLEDVSETELASERDAVFVEVASRLSSEAVSQALASIPEHFAAAVEMHDMDGLTYREIAEALTVPVGTVMSRISRGRRLIADAVTGRRDVEAAQHAGSSGRRVAAVESE